MTPDPTDQPTTPATTPKRRRKPAATPTPPPEPMCPTCGAVLDWRDQAYGRDGACKRCTQRARETRARGRFIPAAVYVAQLARGGRA